LVVSAQVKACTLWTPTSRRTLQNLEKVRLVSKLESLDEGQSVKLSHIDTVDLVTSLDWRLKAQ
jgi:hypothetical protein